MGENPPYETMRDLAVAAMNGSTWVALTRGSARQICEYLTLEEIDKFLANSGSDIKTGIEEYLQERQVICDIEEGFATVDKKGNLVYHKENSGEYKNSENGCNECPICSGTTATNKDTISAEECGTTTEG